MAVPVLSHPDEAVLLRDIERPAGVLFRALGQDRTLRIAPGLPDHAPWRDGDTLRLPPMLAVFSSYALNRELYLWWVALGASVDPARGDEPDWLARAQAHMLERYPGLRARWTRLCAAGVEAGVDIPPLAPRAPAPRDRRSRSGAMKSDADQPRATGRDDDPTPRALTHTVKLDRNASIAEFIQVQGDGGDDDPLDQPHSRGLTGVADTARVHFDIDAPTTGHDDVLVGEGIPVDEWDYRKRILLPDHCRVQEFIGGHNGETRLPERLRRPATRLRQQFAALVPQRLWVRGQPDGSEPDLDAYVRLHADRLAGSHDREQNLYITQINRERDLACLVLADLSLSTEARVSPTHSVLDVIRDSLMLFAEALGATGDAFGMYGFSSNTRAQVRFHRLKEFGNAFDGIARGRIAGLRPGYYTRLGPAIRHATRILERQSNAMRVLLVLTDGKPHDVDYYEERYGIEDTRMAVMEARRRRIQPFCVTVDREGSYYLPHLFGPNGFTVLHRPDELTRRLPLLYAQLTGQY